MHAVSCFFKRKNVIQNFPEALLVTKGLYPSLQEAAMNIVSDMWPFGHLSSTVPSEPPGPRKV